jgi:hypothetical protein
METDDTMLNICWNRYRRYIRIILLYTVFSLVMTLAGYAAFRTIPWAPDYGHINPVKHNWLNVFLRWDAIHYANIAGMGYGVYSQGNYAFFPLYPVLIWCLSAATGMQFAVSGIIISRFGFLAAVIMLYELARNEFGEKLAERSVICLFVFPGSFFFLSAYTESLSLLLAVCTFLFCRRKKWLAASLTVMLFGALKQIGVVLGLIVLLEYLRQADNKLKNIRPDILWLCFIPLGLFSYMAYLWLVKGDPLYFLGCEQYYQRRLELPGIPIYTSAVNTVGALRCGLYKTLEQQLRLKSYILEIFMSVSAGGLLVYVFRRLDRHYFIYCVIMIIIPFSTAVGTEGLCGMMRYAVVLFPLYFAAAHLFERKSFKYAYLTIGSILNVVFMSLFACWYWVA